MSSASRRPTPKPEADKPWHLAVEKPTGMIKGENDYCLTCIHNNRKCTGPALKEVSPGDWRCQNCATKTSTNSTRRCFWRDPANGIFTHSDAMELAGYKKKSEWNLQRKKVKDEHVIDDEEDDLSAVKIHSAWEKLLGKILPSDRTEESLDNDEKEIVYGTARGTFLTLRREAQIPWDEEVMEGLRELINEKLDQVGGKKIPA